MHWQPFWDSFKAAVDTNRSLTGVQKLSYLRAQLQGEACDVIAGFPLINISYADSVQLLKERFGQPYKQVDAHRQALVDLLGPSHTISSVRQFHDAIESHIRSLTALGQSEDSYGGLLTTILLGKIPGKMKQNMARAHSKREWTITDLWTAIRDELYIFELRSHTEPNASIPPHSFLSSASLHMLLRVRYNVPSARVHILLQCVTKSLILESVSAGTTLF